MLDPETCLVELYVCADEFGKTHLPPERRPGPAAALDRAEVLSVAIFSQWRQFPSAAAFYRWATKHLRPLFPTLPSRPQFNRLVRRSGAASTAFALHLGQGLARADRAYAALDGTGVRPRNAKRRGRGGWRYRHADGSRHRRGPQRQAAGAGWLAGLADIGKCTRLGWYEGMRLLLAVTPRGAVTGWGLGPASRNDRAVAEPFFAVRAVPEARLAGVGQPVSDCYIADRGFRGAQRAADWASRYGAVVVCPPQTRSRKAWPKARKTWLAGIRQVIESVNDRLLATFGLDDERPHDLRGLQARLAAKSGRHNVCLWLNRKFGRPDLAFADVMDW